MVDTKVFDGKLENLENKLFDEKLIMPDYNNLCIVNLYSLIEKFFEIKCLSSSKMYIEHLPDFTNISKIVLFIIDGLGYNFLKNHLSKTNILLPNVKEGFLTPITSTFPSTTSTSLTSLFTAQTPVEHGIIGYTMYLKSLGLIMDMLNFTPIYGWMSNENIIQELSSNKTFWIKKLMENGISVSILTRYSTVESGLSKIIYRDQKITTYVLATDLMVNLKKLLESPNPLMLIVYYPGYDTLSHLYGPFSEEAETDFIFFENLIKTFLSEKLDKKIKDETLFILTSDHGQAQTENIIFIKDMPRIFEHLIIPPAGDSRATFLFIKQNRVEALKGLLQKELVGFKIFDSDEMLDNGFFGTPNTNEEKILLDERIGDLTLIATGQNAILYPYSEKDRERSKKGSHGGLSLDEMLVPLFTFKL
ncbi:MAG: alkaline phosphatase family protein [Nitrososphaeria archaeon]|nr:alkaline phosphatase family protein [Nitrososphaeria archaeon]